MLLFRGDEHIGRWCAQWKQPRGATLTIAKCWELAQAWYGGKMRGDWRRPSLDETEARFASLGLTGDFWRLR
ncbi:MAG TPA: hypothetical protein VGF59_11255 [Bryobacteraceae bacterium]|jgi:hypothetical protein